MSAIRCPVCQAEIQSEMTNCPSCGKRLDSDEPNDAGTAAPAADPPAAASPAPPAATSPGQRIREAIAGDGSDSSDVESELWEGGYSAKAMFGTWISTAAATIVALIVGAIYARSGLTWGIMLAVMALVWAVEGLLLLYRRLNVHYRLTTQRLLHERGILSRSTDRIEVIDMDDITTQQGFVERLLGVGTIKVLSSDKTDPEFYLVGIENVHDVYDKLDRARRTERTRRGLHIEAI